MPNKNGIEALTEVRTFYKGLIKPEGFESLEDFIKFPYIIMMSGFKNDNLSRVILEKGADEFLKNPIDNEDFERIKYIYLKLCKN